jgi:hypothetical protein
MPEPALPPVSRRHLDVLSDDTAIMQHAIGSRPDPAHGYCTDDVSRALQVDLLHARVLGWSAVADRAARNLWFLEAAFDPAHGRFRNFRTVDGAWIDGVPSEDSQGRAMHALGDTMAMASEPVVSEAASDLFARALPGAQGVGAMRAQSSVMLGCDAAMRARPNDRTALAYRQLATRLRTRFESRAGMVWPWPESRLTYENALPVRALIVAGGHQDKATMVDMGLGLLDWLIDVQTGPAGQFSPIGNHWWPCGGPRSRFDQQPIEATTMILASEAAFETTSNERYHAAAEQAFAWFLGGNDLGLIVADVERGTSGDGLTATGVNANQGAESTLMWLTALEHIRAMREVRGVSSRTTESPLVGASR